MADELRVDVQKIENSVIYFNIRCDGEINLDLIFELHYGVSEDYTAYTTVMNTVKDGGYWISHPCLICFKDVRLMVLDQNRNLLINHLIKDLDKQSNHAINFLGADVYNKIAPYLNWTYYELFAEGETDRAGLDNRSAETFASCKNVVDLGSNIGFFGKYISRHAKLDNYICVEPNKNFNYPNEVMNKDLAKNHKIYNAAFYDKDDQEIIYYMTKKPIDWSVNTIDEDFKEEFKYLVNSDFEETTTSTITLKKIMEENNLEVIDFLKVDIEGAERYLLDPDNFSILRDKVKYISVEVHSEELREKFTEIFSRDGFEIESKHSIHFQINNTKLISSIEVPKKNMKKKILITGHNGLIGSSLWDRLKNEYQLYGYDIVEPRNNGFHNEVDMIIHCASNCVIREVIKDTSLMMKNIQITHSVMEKARGSGAKVVLMSSSRLNSPYYSPYTAEKQFMENISKAYKDCYGVDSVIVRPETVWGYHKDDNRVIPNWIKLAKNNEDMIVFGDKEKELSPLFVEDFISELVKIINNFDDFKNGDPITITGEIMKACEVIDIIKDFYDSRSNVIFLEPEMSQPQDSPIRKEGDIILKNRLKEKLK